jgi:hypothetical protein
MKQVVSKDKLATCFMVLSSLAYSDSEDGGYMFLHNVPEDRTLLENVFILQSFSVPSLYSTE